MFGWPERRMRRSAGRACAARPKLNLATTNTGPTHGSMRGLYVAGDASRAVQWVVVAAAEGDEAAFAINTDLLREDLL